MNKQAVVVPDLNSDSRVNNELANELDVTTAIVVPLVRESQIIGGISLYRKGTPYTHFDLQTVTLFANQAALSLHNANLFAQRERREKQILELLEVTRHVRSSLSLQDVLNRILEGVIRLISPKPYSSISVMLVDEKTNALTVKAAYGLSQETIRNTREPVGEGIAGWVTKTGDSLLVEDISEHPIFSKNFVARKDRDVITSAISVPLRVQDKIIGVMNVASKEKFDKNRFDEEDVKMMETMADHVAMAIEKSKLYEDLENHYLDTVRALARAVDAKDSYTMDHSQKTSEYAVALAKAMGLNPEDIVDIETASVLHDVGKIGIPDSILMKPGKLTPEEYEEMKKHPELGAKILEPLKQLTGVRELVLYHQERYDGKGYPKGLKGEEIPIGCRIIAVVDAFQAMTSDRIYRKALLKEQAIAELQKYAGTQFDSKVVEAFLFIIQKKPS